MQRLLWGLALIAAAPATAQSLWGPVSTPFNGFIEDLAVDSAGVAYAGDWDLYRSTDGVTWDLILEDIFVQDMIAIDDELTAATLNGVIGVVGDVWVNLLPGIGLRSVHVEDNSLIVGGRAGQVFRTFDAIEWETTNPSRLFVNDESVTSVATNSNAVVYAEITSDFSRQLVAGGPTGWTVQPVASSKVVVDGDEFWAVDGDRFFRSSDGLTWSLAASIPNSFLVSDWVKRGSTLAVADVRGVKLTSDGGGLWTDISSGLAEPQDVDILTLDSKGFLWAVSDSVVQRTLGPIHSSSGTPVDRTAEPPSGVEFDDVYPNPALGSINMEIVTPGGYAIVQVFDMLGRNVDTLHEGEVLPGRLEVVWDGEAAAGTYVVRAIVGEREATRTVVKN